MEGTSSTVVNEEDDFMIIDLPPGYRFHPTDEEIITHYLKKKVMDERFTSIAIGEVDMNKCEPWDLPKKAKMKEKEWYFFCQRDRKYPTGMRTNRATGTGYWKATGKDREIFKGKNCLVGMKKTLVFYKGRAPKGEKSNWVMHEYRLEGNFPYYNFPRGQKDEYVVCKIFHKNTAGGINNRRCLFSELSRNDSFIEEIHGNTPLPPLMNEMVPSSSFKHEFKDILNPSSSSYFSNKYNSNLQIQEPQTSYFVPTYPINGFNPIINQENPDFFHNYLHQECPNLNANHNLMMSPLQDTEISSVISDKVFEDVEGILSVNNNMSDLESLWDY